jgi:hypothetical protein
MIKIIAKLFGKRLSEIFLENYRNDLNLEKEDAKTISSVLSEIDSDSLIKALEMLLKNDKHLFFNSQDKSSQDMTKGAYMRTLYLIREAKKERKVKGVSILKNPRILE